MKKTAPLFFFLCFAWSMASIAMENDDSELNELTDELDANHQALSRAQSESRPAKGSIKIPRKISAPTPRNKDSSYYPIKQSPEVMLLLTEASAEIMRATLGLRLRYKNYKKIIVGNTIDYVFLAKDALGGLYALTVTKAFKPNGLTTIEASARQIS